MATATSVRALPANWRELASNENAELADAFRLLKATFPKRYLHLGKANKIKNKMDHVRGNGNHSLRIYRRRSSGNVDMCAFFFYRHHDVDPADRAYCLSVGVANGITPASLYTDLIEVCKDVRDSSAGVMLNVVNVETLPGDLDDTPEAQIVGGTFTMAAAKLRQLANLTSNRCPWPNDLYRWEIHNLGP